MIRTKDKIYAEPNDPNTVVSNGSLTPNKYVVGNGNKGVKTFAPGPNCILITDGVGGISALSFNGLANRAIATDETGNIVLIDRASIELDGTLPNLDSPVFSNFRSGYETVNNSTYFLVDVTNTNSVPVAVYYTDNKTGATNLNSGTLAAGATTTCGQIDVYTSLNGLTITIRFSAANYDDSIATYSH